MGYLIVFSTLSCPFCIKAKRILQENDLPFVEINLHDHPSQWSLMQSRTNGKSSVPQIFFGSSFIGVSFYEIFLVFLSF